MTHINIVIKKHFTHRYTDRGKVGRQGKITWFKWVDRMRIAKHLKRQASKIKI